MSNNSENTKLSNSTYNVLSAMGKEADFLYSTVDKQIQDAQSDGRQNLVDLWNEIKQDKQKHLSRLKECLEQEAKDNKLSGQSNIQEEFTILISLSSKKHVRAYLTMIKFFNPSDYLPCKNCRHSKRLHIVDSKLPRCTVTGCQCSNYKGYV